MPTLVAVLLFVAFVYGFASILRKGRSDATWTAEDRPRPSPAISRETLLGMEGEEEAAATLHTLALGGTILRNLHLPTNKGTTTEVDLVWVSHKGVFVLEVKNYSGWIFGNERNQYWTQVPRGGLKNQFYNPIRQNGGHIAAIRAQLWRTYQGPYFNIVVFSDHAPSSTSPSTVTGQPSSSSTSWMSTFTRQHGDCPPSLTKDASTSLPQSSLNTEDF